MTDEQWNNIVQKKLKEGAKKEFDAQKKMADKLKAIQNEQVA